MNTKAIVRNLFHLVFVQNANKEIKCFVNIKRCTKNGYAKDAEEEQSLVEL